MADFIIRFLICNVFISGIIGILFAARRIFKRCLSERMQYHLWFLLLGLLAVPFLPFRLIRLSQIFSWLGRFRSSPSSDAQTAVDDMGSMMGTTLSENTDWMNDFTLSVHSRTPSGAGYLLLGLWIAGMLAMAIFVIRSSLRLRRLKKSALPLQSREVHRLYQRCLKELEIHREIPIYSTAFLKSPIFVGILRPRIYLPIHLISDYQESGLRYMLLHELQHYRHHDSIAGYLMSLAGIIYWFNPFVWYALKEMRSDREIACDASVLKMLDEKDYTDYGSTLINFAEKLSSAPLPFASGLAGTMKQMKRRIIHIASYETPTLTKKLKSIAAFALTAVLLSGLAPFLSPYAAENTEKTHSQWDSSSENISLIDLSAYFGDYDGSFVMYDSQNDAWTIHNMELATLRTAPDSTYKIYDALFGLEAGVITPDNSFIEWDGSLYPIDAWNTDQTLQTAMSASVNWYFQTIDERLGVSKVHNYIREIGYGNQDVSGEFPTYWMESSLEVSPVEQVELLQKLQNNDFGFAPENINAVKDALCLSSSDAGTFYGKTGTGRIDGQDVNGWFVGFIETQETTYFFATNIRADKDAAGSRAADITMTVLSDLTGDL